ncbi:hypothetical protein NDU88_000612 [Pleurodeles waltl]|uniref:Uncharacterized protein n=1 Tax=Pleurodeles waltl TaxID=8319 RepID=A0AAV7TFK2_PLEWA|nr:hypothetical protein NDU88_000612 [Pleurodeles waltl]
MLECARGTGRRRLQRLRRGKGKNGNELVEVIKTPRKVQGYAPLVKSGVKGTHYCEGQEGWTNWYEHTYRYQCHDPYR